MFSCLGLLWCWIYIEDPLNKYIKYGIIPTCYFSVWTILYFIQMLPAVGHFVNTIQRMLGYMLQFIVIYAFILIPYPFGFYILLRSTYGCTGPGFENPLEAFYTIFKIMLNMEDFSSYEELTDLQPTYLLHVLYVFTVAILLVNFLIALLSSSVGDVVQAGDVIMMLQRLSVVTVIEKRMLWIFPCFYKFMQHCLYTCENGRIYLVCSRYVNYEEYDTKILWTKLDKRFWNSGYCPVQSSGTKASIAEGLYTYYVTLKLWIFDPPSPWLTYICENALITLELTPPSPLSALRNMCTAPNGFHQIPTKVSIPM